jgi:hypothetical protein
MSDGRPSSQGVCPSLVRVPLEEWHNSSTDFNPKQSQQLSSSASKLPVIFKIHPPSTHISLRDMYFQDWSVYFAAAKYVDRSWEYINGSLTRMNGGIETEVPQFLFGNTYINSIFGTVQCMKPK